MTQKTFYMPIKALNLAHYFASALIKPVKYISNHSVDVQNVSSDCLLLCNKPNVKGMDCSLELIITVEELKDVEKVNAQYSLFKGCLPISRVKKILFSDNGTMRSILQNIEINTAFIPKQIVALKGKGKEIPSIDHIDKQPFTDFFEKIRQYDNILGGLALMRITANYSETYFCCLARYNYFIKNQIKNYKDLYRDSYYSLINKYIKSQLNADVLATVAKQENQQLSKNPITQILDINNLTGATYVLAVIATRKVNDADEGYDTIDSLIVDRFRSVNNDQGEEVAFYYGLKKGYTAFVKRYKDVNYKFELNSQLDYYTVESVFQAEFHDYRSSGRFEYLDGLAPIQKQVQRDNDGYYILDTLVSEDKLYEFGSIKYIESLSKKYGINKGVINRIATDARRYYDAQLEANARTITNNIGKGLFDKIDKNRNGVLEAEELRVFIEDLYKQADKDIKDLIVNFSEESALPRNSLKKTTPKKRKQSEKVQEPSLFDESKKSQ